MSKRVVVAMSGGVDSSVAAAILHNEGYHVTGIMMRLWSEPGTGDMILSNRCCTPDQMADARRVADILGIPFYVLDVQEYFRKNVVEPYITSHSLGSTPNPCIRCNELVRFEYLLDNALALGADYLATGHYARIHQYNGDYQLMVAEDRSKDQSYVLHVLTQDKLKRLLFPLGNYRKEDVRKLAADFGLPVASKTESMDLCFVKDGNTVRFLAEQKTLKSKPGPIQTIDGEIVGQHRGLPFYTIGQRKGLGIALGEPVYVIRKLLRQNALVVGRREFLGKRNLSAGKPNWISGTPPDVDDMVGVKIRYRSAQEKATVLHCSKEEIRVRFHEPVYGITAGQGAVFYDDEICLGGGIIRDTESQ